MLVRRKSTGRHPRPTSAEYLVSTGHLISRLRTKLAQLSNQQEELVEKRERVLVDRQKLVEGWQRVQKQRDQTADAEVKLMDLLRQHYNSINSPFPTELDLAYSIVDEGRTRLGFLESEVTETEENLGAQEWDFMELENDLYQYDLSQLLADETKDDVDIPEPLEEVISNDTEDPMPPSTAIRYRIEQAEHRRLLDCFEDLRGAIAVLFDATNLSIDEADLVDIATSEAVLSFDDVLTQLAECEVRLQHLRAQRVLPADDTQTAILRRSSEPLPIIESLSATSEAFSRAHSEGDISHLPEHVPTIQRIRDWLLDCLKQNALDRMQYFSILQQTLDYINALEFDMSRWKNMAVKRWSDDMAEAKAVQEAAFIPSSTGISGEERDLRSVEDISLSGTSGDDIVWPAAPPLHSHGDTDGFWLDDLVFSSPEDFEIVPRTVTAPDMDRQSTNSRLSPNQSSSRPSRPSHRASASEPTIDTTAEHLSDAIPAKWDSTGSWLCPPRCDSVYGSTAKESLCSRSSQSLAMTQYQTDDTSNPKDRDTEVILNCPLLAIGDHTTTLDTVYSPWQWSSELRRYYYLGFSTDDILIEAVWSEPVPDSQGPDMGLAVQSRQCWRFYT